MGISLSIGLGRECWRAHNLWTTATSQLRLLRLSGTRLLLVIAYAKCETAKCQITLTQEHEAPSCLVCAPETWDRRSYGQKIGCTLSATVFASTAPTFPASQIWSFPSRRKRSSCTAVSGTATVVVGVDYQRARQITWAPKIATKFELEMHGNGRSCVALAGALSSCGNENSEDPAKVPIQAPGVSWRSRVFYFCS